MRDLKFILDSMEGIDMRIRGLVFLSLLFATYCIAQEYPSLSNVKVDVRVTTDPTNGFYDYSYSISNGTASTGIIDGFEVDISRSQALQQMDTIGLRFENDGFAEGSFRRNYPALSAKIVPVGFLDTPYGMKWVGALSNSLTASFFDGVTHAIMPSKQLDGFVLMSKGIPGIRRCVVSPFFDVDSLFPSIDDPNRTISIAQMDSIREAVKYHGWTIGPTAPPLNFDASVWVDTLLSYTHQSVDLGWLGKTRDDDCDNDEHPQDGIEKNIERRLTSAQRELQNGDSVKARKDLQMLVNKVDRIWKRGQAIEKKHEHDRGDWWQHRKDWVVMTSEAYALLKYNTEYLIDRLPERERHEGREKK